MPQHNESERAQPNYHRFVEILVDHDNPPQLLNPIPLVEKINNFLNTIPGKRTGRVTVTLLGSGSEDRRKMFENREQINWAQIFVNMINTAEMEGGKTDYRTGKIILFIDDILATEIFCHALFDDTFNNNETVQLLRSALRGLEAVKNPPDNFLSKIFQHELDHSAKTHAENFFNTIKTSRRIQIRFAVLLGFLGTKMVINQFSPVPYTLISPNALADGGYFLSALSIIGYLYQMVRGRLLDYDVNGFEISARNASNINQGLFELGDNDSNWLNQQKEKSFDAVDSLCFENSQRKKLIRSLWQKLPGKGAKF